MLPSRGARSQDPSHSYSGSFSISVCSSFISILSFLSFSYSFIAYFFKLFLFIPFFILYLHFSSFSWSISYDLKVSSAQSMETAEDPEPDPKRRRMDSDPEPIVRRAIHTSKLQTERLTQNSLRLRLKCILDSKYIFFIIFHSSNFFNLLPCSNARLQFAGDALRFFFAVSLRIIWFRQNDTGSEMDASDIYSFV